MQDLLATAAFNASSLLILIPWLQLQIAAHFFILSFDSHAMAAPHDPLPSLEWHITASMSRGASTSGLAVASQSAARLPAGQGQVAFSGDLSSATAPSSGVNPYPGHEKLDPALPSWVLDCQFSTMHDSHMVSLLIWQGYG